MHPEDLLLVEEEMRRCMQDHKPFEMQYRITWPDGSPRWVETRGIFLYDSEKANRMLGVVMDITDRKQADETLRESQRRYSALFANRINGMAHCRIITDEDGKPIDYWIIQINEAYERIIGIKKADIEGRRVTEVFPGIKSYAFDYIGVSARSRWRAVKLSSKSFSKPPNSISQFMPTARCRANLPPSSLT